MLQQVIYFICGIIGAIYWFKDQYWTDDHLENIVFGFVLGYFGSLLVVELINRIILLFI
mgnify:CR=1 FL=1